MDERSKVVLSVGTYLGGIAGGTAALVADVTSVGSPIFAFVVAAMSGALVGLAVAGRLASTRTIRALIDDAWLVLASSLPHSVLLGASVLGPLVSDASWDLYWLGLAGSVVALVGWIGVIQTGQTSQARSAIARSETAVTLPADAAKRGFFDGRSRYRRVLDVVVLVSVVVLIGTAYVGRNPLALLFVLPGIVSLLSPTRTTVTLTDAGVVFDNRISPQVPLGAKLNEWDAFEDYRLDDGTLTITRTDIWSDLTYDLEHVDGERVTEVLDRHVLESEPSR